MGVYNSNISKLLAKLAGHDVEIPENPISVNAQLLKECIDRYEALSNIGRYLALWDCTTGLPTTEPSTMPYKYETGMYFVVGNIGNTNYKPDGSEYTGTASTTAETGEVEIGDMYRYDGTSWELLKFGILLELYVKKAEISHETWTFTLEDGSTVNKEVVIWNSQE